MDDTGIRWTDAELISYINDAQREIVLFKPDAITRNENLSLVSGTKQTMPTSSIRLLSVIRNNTSASKRSIRPVPRETLDRFKPDWHSEPETEEVQHFITSETDLKNFYVYPPNNGSGEVEVQYTKHPEVLSLNDNLEVADAYANVVLDYTLYRAFAKDGDIGPEAQRSANHYQTFIASLSGKNNVDLTTNPRVLPENPTPGA